jgi:hypothetical protein
MKKHFVTFYSPGTMVAEHTRKEIRSWDIELAIEMMKEIKERHGAIPFGFRFCTMKRGLLAWEPKEIDTSCMHYVNCKVQTLEEVCAHGPEILCQNMKTNGWDRVVTTTQGWEWSQPLREGDVVL